MKSTVSVAETLRKVPLNLCQGVKDSWVKLLKSMILKIQERSLFLYKLVLVVCTLYPVRMATSDPDNILHFFELIVVIIYRHKQITSKQVEAIKEQFGQGC